MNTVLTHTMYGPGVLTDEHSASSYGQPVFVASVDGQAYGPAECADGVFNLILGEVYEAEELVWLKALVDAPDSPIKWRRLPGRPPATDEERLHPHTVRMTDAEWAHCIAQGNASEYIRVLIGQHQRRQTQPTIPSTRSKWSKRRR